MWKYMVIYVRGGMKMTVDDSMEKLLTPIKEKILRNDISSALETLLLTAEHITENQYITNLLGRCYYILGEFERARACWNKSLAIDPENHEALENLERINQPAFNFWLKRYQEAAAEVESRNYNRGLELLQDLIRENDGIVSVYQLLGFCHLAGADLDAACRTWQHGLKLDRSNPLLIRYLELYQIDEIPDSPVNTKNEKNGGLRWVWGLTAAIGMAVLIWLGSNAHMSLLPDRNLAGTTGIKIARENRHNVSLVPALKIQTPTTPDKTHALAEPAKTTSLEQFNQTLLNEKEELLYYSGYKAYDEHDWEQAVDKLGIVVKMQTGSYLNREALYFLARTYFLQENYAKAREYFTRYLAEFPSSNYYDDSLFYLGCSAYKDGDVKTSAAAFEALAKLIR